VSAGLLAMSAAELESPSGGPEASSSGGGEGPAPAATTGRTAEAPGRLVSELVPSSGFLTARPLTKPDSVRKQEEFDLLVEQLQAGREHRIHQRNDAARAVLVPIMEGNAPPEIQQAALLELGLLAEQEREYSRAQQVYNQFLKRYSDSPICPEVLLRQGLIYREMGTPTLAIAKFYSVGTSSLQLKEGNLDTYKRLVLQAQTEIANTYFLQGKFDEAIEFFQRLLKQETVDLHRARIFYKIVQAHEKLGRDRETSVAAEDFLRQFPDAIEAPEVRFLLANAYKRMGRVRDSLQQVNLLLISQQAVGRTNRSAWAYWQQRAGNEIANQLYQEGDYVSALEVYNGLLPLNGSLEWQVPLLYQIGLTYEKLEQPRKAHEAYRRILGLTPGAAATLTGNLRSVVDMARWRTEQMQWSVQAQATNSFFSAAAGAGSRPGGEGGGRGTVPAVPKP
jgi:tetratricopeptide (TPR) repeat protein